jgi:hypothetical protein
MLQKCFATHGKLLNIQRKMLQNNVEFYENATFIENVTIPDFFCNSDLGPPIHLKAKLADATVGGFLVFVKQQCIVKVIF